MLLTILIFTPLLYFSYAFRHRIHERITVSSQAKAGRWIIVAVVALIGLFFAYMGFGEMAGGDMSGSMHLVTLVLVAAVLYALLVAPKPKVRY